MEDTHADQYEAPQLIVLASVEEATLMGTEGQLPDGVLGSQSPPPGS
jgi:hypothetical protein